VLFNEPKLLKCDDFNRFAVELNRFSALQRAEIAEIRTAAASTQHRSAFQCSSTSRNC